jgi:hypothetical protein
VADKEELYREEAKVIKITLISAITEDVLRLDSFFRLWALRERGLSYRRVLRPKSKVL